MDSVSKSSVPGTDASPAAAPSAPPPEKPFGGSPVGAEIEAVVRQYYVCLAEDNYEGAVALMQPGMRVFTPFGTLMHLPNDAKTVVAIYGNIHGQGFHMGYTPLQIEGEVYGDVAFAAFLLQGFESAPGGKTNTAVRRGTQVWVKQEDGQWRIAHMHVSTSDAWEDWRGKLAAK